MTACVSNLFLWKFATTSFHRFMTTIASVKHDVDVPFVDCLARPFLPFRLLCFFFPLPLFLVFLDILVFLLVPLVSRLKTSLFSDSSEQLTKKMKARARIRMRIFIPSWSSYRTDLSLDKDSFLFVRIGWTFGRTGQFNLGHAMQLKQCQLKKSIKNKKGRNCSWRWWICL